MSDLLDYARKELELAGFYKEDADYGEGELAANILKLIDIFSQQGHSGMSASIVTAAITKLMRYEPLTPLTGADDEWICHGDVGGFNKGDLYQNIRCSHVFKDNNGAYDINGKVFREPDGYTYTSYESRVPVEFPYIPKIEYVDVPERKEE